MDVTTVKAKIKEMLCERLGIEADVLDYDTPLFNEGIGLDSIDSLEIISLIFAFTVVTSMVVPSLCVFCLVGEEPSPDCLPGRSRISASFAFCCICSTTGSVDVDRGMPPCRCRRSARDQESPGVSGYSTTRTEESTVQALMVASTISTAPMKRVRNRTLSVG